MIETIIAASEKSNLQVVEDIYDESGNKLLGAGYIITPKIREKLFDRILKKPLETSIKSDNSITNVELSESALKELTDNPILKYFKSDLKTEAKELRYLNLEPLAILILSVIRDTEEKKFKHLLLITLLARAIGKEMDIGTYEMTNLSLSSILHDIGELYVSIPEAEKLTDEHWQKVMVHPIVGSSIVKKYMSYPLEVSTAILEHHERCNGNGYPRHIDANKCSVNGQILILAESIAGIVKKEKELQGALMVLKISFANYPSLPLEAFKNIIDLNSYIVTDNNESFTQDSIKKTIKKLSELQLKITEHINNNELNNIAKHLELRLIKVNQSFYESGITHYLDDELWGETAANQYIRAELEITIQEIEWQIQDIARHIDKLG